jgi:hypothetical protein
MQPLAVLFLVGAAASLLKRWRLASWLALVAAAQLLASTALVGEVPRYRYPVDPFIWIVAAIGVSAIIVGAGAVARRFMTAPGAPAHQPIPATGDPTTG